MEVLPMELWETACVCSRYTDWVLSNQTLLWLIGGRVVKRDLVNNGTDKEEEENKAEKYKEEKEKERGKEEAHGLCSRWLLN